mmetsp:Transcript_4686/g.5317  ORF Transcript_4686/g.5317 Transcript_4686/m.5317 type:complete len:86 (-) Transcript_4686:174-431(-)
MYFRFTGWSTQTLRICLIPKIPLAATARSSTIQDRGSKKALSIKVESARVLSNIYSVTGWSTALTRELSGYTCSFYEHTFLLFIV